MGIIEFKDVSFQYPNGFSAVENVSFEINEGEAIAIIGQNGAGKTTTVKMINGLLKPTHGTVLIDGMDTKDYTTAQLSKIAGYVFQNPDDQIFHNNVEDEIRFGPKKQGLSEEEIVKKTEWAAKLCGLSEQMQENPYNLPLSIRKFVSIASVLAMDDKILILDEPTAGQDLIGINRLENILTELKKENKTVVTITHDMEFAVNNFKKIFVMSHKNLLRVGNAKEIFSDDELLKDSMLKKTYIGDLCDRLAVLDLSENGRQIGEKLFVLLDVEQKREMIQFVLETEQQQGFSAIPCTNPDSFGARIDTSQPLTEIREGDLYFCLEEREVAVQGKKVDLSVREFNALYLLLMNRRRVMTFETIAYHVWSEEYVENELTAIHNIMSRLRQKLKISPDIPDYIISVRGVGYKFDTTQQKK